MVFSSFGKTALEIQGQVKLRNQVYEFETNPGD